MTVVDIMVYHRDVLVIQHSIAVEHILLPLSFVGYFSAGIVEYSFAFHPIPDPLSAVLASFLVVEGPKTMSVLAEFVSLVSALRHILTDIAWMRLLV